MPNLSIPTMDDVAAIRGTNGYKVASTFSGCGGSCLGFEMAGFEIVYASEFVEAARNTYRLNHPGVFVDERDIRKVTADQILEVAGVERGELDVFEGSPPCASFSTSGKRERGWGETKKYSDTEQRADDLFFEYARLIDEIQPRTFVAENVAGLVRGTAKGYFKDIIRRLKSCGYAVEAKLLDASYLGVPQARNRLIFVGVRNDLGHTPRFPKPQQTRLTLGDALGSRPARPGPYIDPETQADIGFERYAIYREWRKLKPGEKSEKYLNLIRPHPGKPVNTITATAGNIGAASVTHPHEPRKFNLRELRRLSGFPDDFVLTGKYEQRAERIGRAVPPVMMRAVAREVEITLRAIDR